MVKFINVFAIGGALILLSNLWQREKFSQIEELTASSLCRDINKLCPQLRRITLKPGRQSVTLNKTNISICMKDPNTNQLYDYDVLLYVALHEIAHVISETYSIKTHNKEFTDNFNKLLKKAVDLGILSTINVPIPATYCKGLPVN